MGARGSKNDFDWVYTEEPHATRRKLILAKYPEVKQLMGHDSSLKYAVLLLVLAQIVIAYWLQSASWYLIIFLSYIVGGVINHSLFLSIHELAHNLAFGHKFPGANKYLSIFANLPIGVPMALSFKKYHLEHHRYQGNSEMDVDIPTKFEAKMFNNTLSKIIWVILQPFFYSIRPLIIQPKPMSVLELVNIITQFAFNYLILQCFGVKSIVYLILGSFLGTGLHPMSGHFISEHYVFNPNQETYSYYGSLNLLTFNVGYHNEHHDFPFIAGSKLPKLRKIAPEFYDSLHHHTSWIRVIWDFITRSDVGLYSRIKRPSSNDALYSRIKQPSSNDAPSNGCETNVNPRCN